MVAAFSRVLVRPLTLPELALLRDGHLDKVEPRIDAAALTEDTLAAVGKKVEKMQLARVADHSWYTYWLIIERTAGIGVGFVGFKGPPDADGLVEVGYGISPNHRGRGLMTEALRLLVRWAAAFPRCKGVTARQVLKDNVASQRVLAKCGFELAASREEYADYILRFGSRRRAGK